MTKRKEINIGPFGVNDIFFHFFKDESGHILVDNGQSTVSLEEFENFVNFFYTLDDPTYEERLWTFKYVRKILGDPQ